MLVAIDRTSKFAFVELHERVSRRTAADLRRPLIDAVPYNVHAVLTDNGTHYTTPGNVCSAAKDIPDASPPASCSGPTASSWPARTLISITA